MFIGRDRELETLSKLYSSNKFKLIEVRFNLFLLFYYLASLSRNKMLPSFVAYFVNLRFINLGLM